MRFGSCPAPSHVPPPFLIPLQVTRAELAGYLAAQPSLDVAVNDTLPSYTDRFVRQALVHLYGASAVAPDDALLAIAAQAGTADGGGGGGDAGAGGDVPLVVSCRSAAAWARLVCARLCISAFARAA
mgnify:CR=1 FL=1